MPVGTPVLVGSGTGLNQVIPAGGVAVGQYLVLAFNHVGGTIVSIADTRGNTYTLLRSKVQSTGGAQVQVYGAPVTTALQSGDTISVTTSGSPSATTHVVMSISSIDLVNPLDVGADNGGTSNSFSTGTTAATAQADAIAIAAYGDTGGTCTYTAPYTKTGAANASGFLVHLGYRVLTATGTQQGTATNTSSETYAGVIVVLKGASSLIDSDTVRLSLVPSSQEAGSGTDAGTALLKLTASGTDVYAAHLTSDAATVPLKFKIPEEDAATVRLALTPASEDVGPITDEATVPLLFTPFGTPGAIIDAATVRLALTPSGIDTFHQCKPRFTVTLLGWSIDPDYDHFWRNWIGGLEDRNWQAELVPAEAVVNHPC